MRAPSLTRNILLAMSGFSAGASAACGRDAATPTPAEASTTTPTGATTGDGAPWADRVGRAGRESREDRLCFEKATIYATSKTGAPSPLVCPNTAKIVELGLFTPPPALPPGQMAMSGTALTEGPVEWKGQCCYLTSSWHTGRPLVVGGRVRRAGARVRGDWGASRGRRAEMGAPLTREERADLAAAWALDASLEHASVASFARFALDLMALGAPAHLVEAAHRAALDEIEHARLCFALASRYAGEPLGPGPLRVDGAVARADLVQAAVAAAREGCLGETEAAILAQAQLERAVDPQVRRALGRIAADEANHAALAWRFVAWAIARGGAAVRGAVAQVFDDAGVASREKASAPRRAGRRVLRGHGRLDGVAVERAKGTARSAVVGPCARALLA